MTRGLLIAQLAGCKVVQDSCSDNYRYRMLTAMNRCLLETGSIVDAYKVAEEFSKSYLQCSHDRP